MMLVEVNEATTMIDFADTYRYDEVSADIELNNGCHKFPCIHRTTKADVHTTCFVLYNRTRSRPVI